MAPKRNPHARQDGEPLNEWAELRRTLVTMQENIQATIANSIHELTETVLHHQFQGDSEDDVSEQSHVNPFSQNRARGHRNHKEFRDNEQEDRRWESGFRLDLPEFHGSVRGEELLDWLVAVEELLEFKQVPPDRQVALVATKFRGRAASWWL
ncbi:unnamed protein product [Microthlaspi erraticum]|uniref:Retrotransposon gag domain-containing protein n=1 Tax=Microthlaspi erraticum TaxID=1685480 RepID=A0A6D2JI35_9BRAS|nr:unnamed protein product [Microthlaspi erraticum]CAA7036527.1 unnamed protein product [Microthlaspi erraticum]